MPDQSLVEFAQLPAETRAEIDGICTEFEQAWRRGQTPELEDYVSRLEGAVRRMLFQELLYVELECRKHSGEQPTVAQYRDRFRGFRDVVETVFEKSASPEEPALVSEPIPDIPGYRILGEIGRGGMGVVYRARDLRLNRIVALKMISEAVLIKETRNRFAAEAQTVAQLQHPSIVQVFEVGEKDGNPFFAMEYVAGGSLASQLNGAPLAPGRAVEIVEQLCSAIEHAHSNGVIHRDLKPGNVLLAGQLTPVGDVETDTSPKPLVPKISDFGLAKKMREDGQTQTGEVLGTPSYMSPEQALGNRAISETTDVYSLGAMLYELLTGRPPFRGESSLETLNQVVGHDPVPPAQLQPNLAFDLNTICLKCLEKSPDRRYQTAKQLAEDLTRFREGKPINARPTPWWERAAKWTRRHPLSATLGAVSTVATLVLLGVWVVFTAKLQVARNEATENFGRAQQAVRHYLVQMRDDPRLVNTDLIPLRAELLQQATQIYQDLIAGTGDVELRYELAQVHFELAKLRYHQNEIDGALKHFGQCSAICSDLLEQTGDRDHRRLCSLAVNGRGHCFQKKEAWSQSEQCFLEGIRILTAIVAELPDDPSYGWNLAANYRSLGEIYRQTERVGEAEEAFVEAIRLCDPLPDIVGYQFDRARGRRLLGSLYRLNGRLDEAESMLMKAIQISQEVVARSGSPEFLHGLIMTRRELALVLQQTRRYTEAEPLLTQSTSQLGRLARTHTASLDYVSDLADLYDQISNLHAACSRPEDAGRAASLAQSLRQRGTAAIPGSAQFDMAFSQAETLIRQANYADFRAQHDKALASFDKAIKALEELRGLKVESREVDALMLTALNQAATAALRGRRYDDAIAYLNQCGAIEKPVSDWVHALRSRVILRRGDAGGAVEAAKLIKDPFSLDRHERLALASFYWRLAGSLVLDRRLEQEVPSFVELANKVIAKAEAEPGRRHFDLAGCHAEAGRFYRQVAQLDQATRGAMVDAKEVAALVKRHETSALNLLIKAYAVDRRFPLAPTEISSLKNGTRYRHLRSEPKFLVLIRELEARKDFVQNR